ncbi:hypothetical protein TOPH_05329 [Tolypocladium ophioglossoides CBS 100239]|uniref:Uncharacterized protein n=1 Tax=Tolypocladium ophioglossoides (strain CBS 100239) TaxID=1163406 RepID=A0A0L0N774_TOLOC|nr:hypothetical protein TOPH_05329 [Tolypocladium ophioglossoides CBS 100239]
MDDSDYRFLVDGHVSRGRGRPYLRPILLGKLLPSFPTGDWNNGRAARDPETGKATFVKTETVQPAGAKNLWHPVKLNELDFTRQDRVRQRVHISTHPEVSGGKLSNSRDVGPKFLSHLTEGKGGCVVGFVAGWLECARAAGPGDIDDCEKASDRLHELGIKLGDINKHNFLVRDGNDDFDMAKRDCSPPELEDEMSALKSNLESTSFRGGVEPVHK